MHHHLAPDLWHQFRVNLLAYLRKRLPSEADAEDVLQDIFARILQGSGHPDQPDQACAWVYGVARRAVADFYRARARRTPLAALPLDQAPEPHAQGSLPSDNLSPYDGPHDVHEEVLSWLRPLIDALPDMYRVPLLLADVEGLTQQEVADRLGLSLSGAKSRVQRARARLGDLLTQCCAVEFGPSGRAVAFTRLQATERVQERACERAAGCGTDAAKEKS